MSEVQESPIKPRFEAEEVDTEGLTREIYSWDGEKGLEKKVVPETRRVFDVYFPGGHSIRVRGMDEMQRQEFDQAPGLVNMETGDEIPNSRGTSLKENVQRKTKPSRQSRKEKST